MKVILCLGPSSAGKSTLCNELSANHQWITVSGDDEMDKLFQSKERQILKELKDQGIFEALKQTMTEKEIIELCLMGKFNISLGDHREKDDKRVISNFQFDSPDYDGLDEILTKAGFVDEKDKLFSLLKKVGQVYKDNRKLLDLDQIILEEAFKFRDDPTVSIIIDTVPNVGEHPKKLLDKFAKRAEQFRAEHPGVLLETFTVLAYTSPQELSERVTRRNVEADEKRNLKNKREGTFPFHQLGTLLTVNKDEKKQVTEASKNQFLTIAYKHQRPDAKEQKKGKFKKVADAALESVRLSKRFGVWSSSTDTVSLAVRGGLEFDAMIDTTKGKPTPQTLANTLIQSIEDASKRRKEKSAGPV